VIHAAVAGLVPSLYWQAVQAACQGRDPVPALARASRAQPGHAASAVDYWVLTDRQPGGVARPATRWERQHVEVMVTLATGSVERAAGLLQEHIAEFGCDPLALLAVRRAAEREGWDCGQQCRTCPGRRTG
jgi:hypothetical protein